jgi:hypothetical protein
MKLTLAQLIPLIKLVRVRIIELAKERERVAVVQIEKGEMITKPARSFEIISQELSETRNDLVRFEHLKNESNLRETVSWDNKEICLADALILAKELQSEVAMLKALGTKNKVERSSRFIDSSGHLLNCTTYDPEVVWNQALKLQRQVSLLSQLIERKNHFSELDIENADKYLA